MYTKEDLNWTLLLSLSLLGAARPSFCASARECVGARECECERVCGHVYGRRETGGKKRGSRIGTGDKKKWLLKLALGGFRWAINKLGTFLREFAFK